MSIVTPPSASAVPPMLWPPPRTATASRWSRAKSIACTTSAAPVACTTSAGDLVIAPFHSRVASAKPSSPGVRSGPRRRSRRSSASSARTNASGSSICGASAQSSITWSGHPYRALAAAATASDVARSFRPQISAVGTPMRSSPSVAAIPNRPISAAIPGDPARSRFCAANGSQRSPIRSRRRSRSKRAARPEPIVRRSGRLAMKACNAAPNSGAGANGASPSASTSTDGRSGGRGRARTPPASAPPAVLPTRIGGSAHVASISASSQPTRSSVQTRAAVPRQVGCNQVVAADERGNDAIQSVALPAGSVEQHERRPVAALEHGGRSAGRLDPALVLRGRRPVVPRAGCRRGI